MRNSKSKKTALALAVMAAAAIGATQSAQAQNVTIYGILDAAVERLDHVGANGDTVNRVPGLTGGISPSRFGLRGTEDLGGGLKATFVLEQGIGVDSGTLNQGGRAWGRQAFVGLQGDFGTVSVGRQYSMLFWSQLDADILGPAMFGSGSLDSYLPNSRVDNTVAWRGTFGGFTAGATYSFGRDAVNAGPSPAGTNCAGESATDTSACKQWSALAKYEGSNWGATAAIDEIRGGAGAFAGLVSSSMKDRRSTVTAWFKPDAAVKLGIGLIARKNDASTTTPKSNLWYVAAAWNISPQFTLDGEVFKLDYKNSANQATLYAVRGIYNLSKRTALYATGGHIANDGTLALSVSNAAAGNGPAAGNSQTGLGVGIRHSF